MDLIIYSDLDIAVCIKPAGVLSTDEPGGLPELVREQGFADVRTVHRLDRVVSGLTVLALNAAAASFLSACIREGGFKKEYLAVVHGETEPQGEMHDLLWRDKKERKTYVVKKPGKNVQEAALRYRTLAYNKGMSKVSIELLTGRTHQIRCQFSSRGLPLVGDKKYSVANDECNIALWSAMMDFPHPSDGKKMHFTALPPESWPWVRFSDNGNNKLK